MSLKRGKKSATEVYIKDTIAHLIDLVHFALRTGTAQAEVKVESRTCRYVI